MNVRARVRNGRLVVDEPTDLPEGTEVELTVVGDALEKKRAALREAIDEGDPGRAPLHC